MNILKHKSWHVYNDKNRERVRRDEQELAEQEERERERALIAEKERRLAALRIKSKDGQDRGTEEQKGPHQAATSGTTIYSGGHINFWAGMESGATSGGLKNAEREEEDRKAREAADRKTTTYLTREPLPWYSKSRDKASREEIVEVTKGSKRRSSNLEDPVSVMEKARRKEPNSAKSRADHRAPPPPAASESQADTLARLREERLRREKAEQDRIRALGLGGQKTRAVTLDDERTAGYSSAFHPELQRKKARFAT